MKVKCVIDTRRAIEAGCNQTGEVESELDVSKLSERLRKVLIANTPITGLSVIRDVTSPAEADLIQRLEELAVEMERREAEEIRYREERHRDVRDHWINNDLDKLVIGPVDNGATYIKSRLNRHFQEQTMDTASRQAVLSEPEVAAKIAAAEAECARRDQEFMAARKEKEELQKARRQKELQEEQAREETRKATLREIVAAHMNPAQQRRYNAGLMKEDEIVDRLREVTFAPLDGFARYQRITSTEVYRHLEGECDLCFHGDWPSSAIKFARRDAEDATDVEFERIEKIKELLPGADVTLVEHFGYHEDHDSRDDPELTRRAIRVAISRGGFDLTREYAVD